MRDRTPKAPEQGQAIDLTPMLDVVFIMLIFFIVTASFIKEAGIDITRTGAVMADKKKVSILVAINDNNEIWIDKKLVDPRAVKLSILRLYAENPKGGMVIQADNQADIEMVGLVADAAKEVGVVDISVSTEEK
ncbi:MAG: biopolymer transporter ExbD [Porticoccaceae bacterium]|nr:biopolymer transporter ExbD [Pseudomonadales bacterium]